MGNQYGKIYSVFTDSYSYRYEQNTCTHPVSIFISWNPHSSTRTCLLLGYNYSLCAEWEARQLLTLLKPYYSIWFIPPTCTWKMNNSYRMSKDRPIAGTHWLRCYKRLELHGSWSWSEAIIKLVVSVKQSQLQPAPRNLHICLSDANLIWKSWRVHCYSHYQGSSWHHILWHIWFVSSVSGCPHTSTGNHVAYMYTYIYICMIAHACLKFHIHTSMHSRRLVSK